MWLLQRIYILQAVQALKDTLDEQEEQTRYPTSHGLKLKHFHGYPHEDIQDWITKINNLADFIGWKVIRKAKALPFYLDGLAATYFSHLPQDTQNNSTSALDALSVHISTAPIQFMLKQELSNRKQAATESLED